MKAMKAYNPLKLLRQANAHDPVMATLRPVPANATQPSRLTFSNPSSTTKTTYYDGKYWLSRLRDAERKARGEN